MLQSCMYYFYFLEKIVCTTSKRAYQDVPEVYLWLAWGEVRGQGEEEGAWVPYVAHLV